jgi:cytochrome c oxidase subunit 4
MSVDAWPRARTKPNWRNAAMSDHGAHVDEHFAGSNKLFISIWVWLLILTLLEIFLAYRPMDLLFMLTILLGLSLIKAALIMAYFMHLKFERLSLILTLIPALVVCILLLLVFFPDSFRSLGLRYQYKEAPPVAPAPLEEH